MVDGALALLRERSSAGVSVDAVLARSGAPRGSVYHHFPGGRDQIIREAVQSAGRHVAGMIEGADSAGAVITRFASFWEHVLRESDFLCGCPVVALTVDSEPGRSAEAELVSEVFMLWQARLRAVFTADGIPSYRVARLATLVLAAAEGAILLSRAQRSYEPLQQVCGELHDLVESARQSSPAPASRQEPAPEPG
jgi:TetR/AcrR family transcriptional regulator, lmrAB and yxaGH operons repressor